MPAVVSARRRERVAAAPSATLALAAERAGCKMGAAASEPIDDESQFVPDPEPRRWSGLRILCLHGHASNNDITEMQVAHLRLRQRHGISCDVFRGETETMFPSNSTFELFSDGPFYTWFDNSVAIKGWLYNKLGRDTQSSSLEAALRRVMALVQARGPYDGIYGFSQGGFMAAALCNRSVWHGMFGLEKCPFRFAILACSALDSVLSSCDVPLQSGEGRSKLALPVGKEVSSLHLVGESDWHRSASHGMAKHFEESRTYVHASGHEIPMRLQLDEKLAQQLREFFEPFSAAGAYDSRSVGGVALAESVTASMPPARSVDAVDDRTYDLW